MHQNIERKGTYTLWCKAKDRKLGKIVRSFSIQQITGSIGVNKGEQNSHPMVGQMLTKQAC
jgi:hypothetical protein